MDRDGQPYGTTRVRASARRAGRTTPSRLAVGLALACFVLTGLGPARVRAQELPPDVASPWSEEAQPALPAPPADYTVERRGRVDWVFPKQATSEARSLENAFDGAWRSVITDMGGSVDSHMTIRIGRNPEEMAALAPVGFPPPEYASGVAYPAFGVILLTLTAPETWQRPDMDVVLTHELSHVALRRAVDGHPLPRWFVEGVAIHQSHEFSLARMRTLWEATIRHHLLPLNELSARFPSRVYGVQVAYAESADVVAYLRHDDTGAACFRELIRKVRAGMTFPQAVRAAYGMSLGDVERDWHAGLSQRFQTLPLLVGGGSLWVLVTLLLFAVWARRRRRNRAKLVAWAEKDALVDRLESVVDARLAEPPPSEPVEGRMLMVVTGEHDGRDPEVPTVEYEGRNHTLH